MKLAIEPKDIDLVVEPHKYTKEDSELMSKIIKHYKDTGEILKVPQTSSKRKSPKVKKELITKP